LPITPVRQYGVKRRVNAHKLLERLVREAHTSRLTAKVGELDPHVHVVRRRDDKGAQPEHPLPDLDVALAALQTGLPGASHGRLLPIVALLVHDELLEFGKHLHANHNLIRSVVGLADKGTQLRVEALTGLLHAAKRLPELVA